MIDMFELIKSHVYQMVPCKYSTSSISVGSGKQLEQSVSVYDHNLPIMCVRYRAPHFTIEGKFKQAVGFVPKFVEKFDPNDPEFLDKFEAAVADLMGTLAHNPAQ